jgi:hypothetical protein
LLEIPRDSINGNEKVIDLMAKGRKESRREKKNKNKNKNKSKA